MIIPAEKLADRIRLIAIENMKGAFGNEGALLRFSGSNPSFASKRTFAERGHSPAAVQSSGQNSDDFGPPVSVEV